MNSKPITTITPTPCTWKRLLLVIAGALIMAVNLNTFVYAGELFPGGFAGVSLLVQRTVLKFCGVQVPYSALYLALNAFPVYISFRYIGRRFTLYSVLMIVISSLLADVIPSYALTDDVLLCAVFGGMMNGFAVVCCLFADATSGGTDFIAIYFAERRGRDMWNVIFAGNCIVLAVAGLLFGWNSALYSIIFQFASTQVLNMLYHRYQKATLLIITSRPDELYHVIQNLANHSATKFAGRGCFRGEEKFLLYTVVSGDQAGALAKELRKADPDVFINVLQTKELLGRFFTRAND
ncbi:MAG: YitT family protein [Treponema sp.]|nr:YitT family protein [Treponema sp.]